MICRERQHEDWIEDISKGIGNTKRIYYCFSQTQQYMSISSLLQEEEDRLDM